MCSNRDIAVFRELNCVVNQVCQNLGDFIAVKPDFWKIVFEVEQKVDAFKKELDTVLSDKNIQELANFLENLDENMIGAIRQEIINRAAKRLDLTPEQLEKVVPILGEELDKRGALLEKFLKQGPEALNAFNLENDKLRQDMNARLAKILTPKQMQGVEQWQTEVGGKIDKLFQEKK